MGSIDLPNVCQKKGRTYYRKKEAGKDFYVRLPDPDEPGFAEAYQRLKNAPERPKPKAGTMAALVAEYRASAEFKNIPSDNTRQNYGRYLDMLVADHGDKLAVDLSQRDIYRERDKMGETPGKANNWVARLNTLMKFAILRGYRQTNPAAEIKPLPIGEHEPWPKEVLEVALANATPMTRLAIVTGLCTGARIGDAIKLRHDWHDGEMLEFRSSKKQIDVAVPMHPLLIAELAKHERKAVTLLYDRSGKPFKSTSALQERIRDLMKSVGRPGYSFHGLRKNAACYLAELGLSDREIGSILAMTPDTVRHYTKRSRALMVAKGAAERIKKGDVISFAGGRGK
jgi:integrase